MFLGLKGNSLLPCCSHSPTLLASYADVLRALSSMNLWRSLKRSGYPFIGWKGNDIDKFHSVCCVGENGQKILLITVPTFSNTKTCVLLNLRTLTCHPVSFSASLSTQQDNSTSDEEMELWIWAKIKSVHSSTCILCQHQHKNTIGHHSDIAALISTYNR